MYSTVRAKVDMLYAYSASIRCTLDYYSGAVFMNLKCSIDALICQLSSGLLYMYHLYILIFD